MTRRRWWIALLVSMLSSGALFAHAQRDIREVAAPPIGPGGGVLVAHEWGVWRIEEGRVAHLADLARESPPFVVQSGPGDSGVVLDAPIELGPAPPLPGRPVVARKPVLFFYADRPVELRVTVGFRGGRPWLFFPAATTGIGPAGPTLTWVGRVDPALSRTAFAPVDPAHFWNELRSVNATPFVSGVDGRTEGFLFYDGPVAFEGVFAIDLPTGRVVPQTTERDAWLVRGEAVTHVRFVGRASVERTTSSRSGFRATIIDALRSRGLTTREAVSLVETWRDELFSPAPHAVYFVPREAYDRMLPLSIEPVPTELVRVGLVIER